jgi:predicted transglutaminase-like cysteine proteinase
MKGCLKTIVVALIFGFIIYYVLPDIFNSSETDTPSTTTQTVVTVPITETTSTQTPLTATLPVTKTPSSSIVITPSEAIAPITALEPNPQSTELIDREFKWDYRDSEWTWNMQIPKAIYDYYKELPRSPTSNYSIYVTHPLDDSLIDQLASSLTTNAQKEGYDSFQTVSFAAAFVQSLKYTSDLVTSGFDEYPRYPFETLVDEGGDCEDTAILAASLIRALGYDVILLRFDKTADRPGHLAVGVKGSEGIYGTSWTYKGDKYYYLETTSTGWEIGQIPDDYRNSSAHVFPMIPVPILTHDWTTEAKGLTVELKVTVNNLGSAMAEDVYVYAGFDAGNDQCWNPEKSPLFDLDVNESVVATVYLTPPLGEHTRLVIQIAYGGYAVDESHSTWFDTY